MTQPDRGHPSVSVILTSFNQRRYLRAAVESVLHQTLADYELLLVDNGSTDGSQSVLEGYRRHPQVRLMCFSDNGPITQRFNAAVQDARGEYVTFLFSDDYYLPHKLRRQVEIFAGLPDDYGVVYGPVLRQNELSGVRWRPSTIRASGDVFRSMMTEYTRGPVEMIGAMVRRDCLLRHPFHEDMFSEGESVFFRLALTDKFAFLDEPLAVMRDHETNMGKALIPNVANIRLALAKLRQDSAIRDDQRSLVDRFEGSLMRSCGWQGARLGVDAGWVRSCFVGAIRLSWRHAVHPKTWGGIALSLLPGAPRRVVNAAGHALRRAPGNPILRDDYDRPKGLR